MTLSQCIRWPPLADPQQIAKRSMHIWVKISEIAPVVHYVWFSYFLYEIEQLEM
jgi:hypothetical protein